MPVLNVNKLIENRVNAIRAYHEKSGVPRAQLDVSGGIDSAVMLGLLARALGPDNITAVYSGIDSSEDSRERARETAARFGVRLIDIDLSEIFHELVGKMHGRLVQAGYDFYDVQDREDADPTVLGSIRSTLRAPVGRGFNRMLGNGIRHGTGNECEDRWLRFYQKGGDGEVDTNPIAMLSKGEVYQLAIGLDVPERVLQAVPSPDLHANGGNEHGHTDESELKALYGVNWTYSRVFLRDGEEWSRGDYARAGTIERMSRLLDECEAVDYDPALEIDTPLLRNFARLYFPESLFTWEEVKAYVVSAVSIERATRHKHNPNCPTLGSRRELVDSGILTNELPTGLKKAKAA